MVHHLGLNPERLVAYFALEGQLALVHEHVGLQVMSLHVRLTADGAHELALGRVPLDVGLKPIVAKVRLRTLLTFVALFVAMFALVTVASLRRLELEATDRTDVSLGHVDSLLVDLEVVLVGEAFVTDRTLDRTVLVLGEGGLDFVCTMSGGRVSHQLFHGVELLVAALGAADSY